MSPSIPTDRNRQGVVLLIVIVTLLMISATAVGLVSLAQTEYRATKLREEEVVLEHLLDSAEAYLWEMAKAPAEQRRLLSNPAFNPELLRPINLHSDDPLDPQFRILPAEGSYSQGNQPMSWTNESEKLNLWALREWDRENPGQAMVSLLEIPRITPEIAVKILAVIGIDSYDATETLPDSRQNPVTVRSFSSPVPTLLGLEDLILRTETPYELWFHPIGWKPADRVGEDDATAADSQTLWASPPLSEFLTLLSLEKNETSAGQERIYLNQPNLRRLHAAATSRLGKEFADFVVLYRQYGPSDTAGTLDTISDASIDFSVPASFQFISELDLVGCQIQKTLPSGKQVKMASPLSSLGTRWSGRLQAVLDQLTVDPRSIIPGRINILTAPREVLLAIPEMDYMLADQILAARQSITSMGAGFYHPSWILEQELVDLTRAKKIVPYMTSSGNVLQAKIEAFVPQRNRQLSRVIVVDGSDSRQGRLYRKETK